MRLIRPGLWQVQPDRSHDEAQRSLDGHTVYQPRRRSPLPARTAALLQRLRAQARGAAAGVPAGVPGSEQLDDADLNRVQLTGCLGGEPLLYDVGDHPVAALALACERRWRASSGAIKVETTWFNLTAWEELAERCGRLLHRGDRVYIEGRLHLWTEACAAQSYACHTVALDRIVLLAAGGFVPRRPKDNR